MGERRDDYDTRSDERSLSVNGRRNWDRRYGGSHRHNRDPPAGRIYIGNLPNRADRHMVEDLFKPFGKVIEISIKRTISGSPFAFVEFDNPRDAQDAIRERDGYKFEGNVLRVEIPFASRGGNRSGNNRGQPRRADFRVIIKGLPPTGSWQDLKDHMREAGDCVYADVFRDGTGVVEFSRREDMDYALKRLSDSKFTSHEGETSRITVMRDSHGDYHRRSYDRDYRRSRSFRSSESSGRHHRYTRQRSYGRYDDDGHRSRHSRRHVGRSDGDGRLRSSYSRSRRSDTPQHSRGDRSRSYSGNR